MPQMAPYNWFMLFLLFNLIHLFMISINYYFYFPSPKYYSNKKIKLLNKFNIKW